MNHIENTVEIKSTPERIFVFVDDIKHMGKHAMYGMGESSLEVIKETSEVVGSEYFFRSKMLGIKTNVYATVTKWIKNQEKAYRFSFGKFIFDINMSIARINEDISKLDLTVDYQVPDSLIGKFMDRLFIRRYVKSEVNKVYERCLDILEKNENA